MSLVSLCRRTFLLTRNHVRFIRQNQNQWQKHFDQIWKGAIFKESQYFLLFLTIYLWLPRLTFEITWVSCVLINPSRSLLFNHTSALCLVDFEMSPLLLCRLQVIVILGDSSVTPKDKPYWVTWHRRDYLTLAPYACECLTFFSSCSLIMWSISFYMCNLTHGKSSSKAVCPCHCTVISIWNLTSLRLTSLLWTVLPPTTSWSWPNSTPYMLMVAKAIKKQDTDYCKPVYLGANS